MQIDIKNNKFDLIILCFDINKRIKKMYKMQLVCNRNTTYTKKSKKIKRVRNINIKKYVCFYKINVIKYQNSNF